MCMGAANADKMWEMREMWATQMAPFFCGTLFFFLRFKHGKQRTWSVKSCSCHWWYLDTWRCQRYGQHQYRFWLIKNQSFKSTPTIHITLIHGQDMRIVALFICTERLFFEMCITKQTRCSLWINSLNLDLLRCFIHSENQAKLLRYDTCKIYVMLSRYDGYRIQLLSTKNEKRSKKKKKYKNRYHIWKEHDEYTTLRSGICVHMLRTICEWKKKNE